MTLWWLSFVDEDTDTFLGVSIVEAPDFLSATAVAHVIGCNPGGQVAGYEIPEDCLAEREMPRGRLLSKEDVTAHTEAMSVREWNEQEASS